MKLLATLSSEVNIKSPKVKAGFVSRLVANIKQAMNDSGYRVKVTKQWSRLYIEVESPDAVDVLRRVFGIYSLSPVDYSIKTELKGMQEVVHQYAGLARGKSVCLRVKRGSSVDGKNSAELGVFLGGILGAYGRKVDLSNPELKVQVLIRGEETVFYHKVIPGAGGLPLGVEGRALCLISGGFDSAVAAWQLMRRGCALDFVFMNLAGQDYERDVLRVAHFLIKQWGHGANSSFYSVDFFPIMDAIREQCKENFAQVVLKRAFYKVANIVADELKDIPALITGEAVGQVSSQTLHNIAATADASKRLVLRPLISFDKQDIIEISRKIGTLHLCEQVKEYCAINPKRPVTKANISSSRREEQQSIDENLYRIASNTKKVIKFSELDEKVLVGGGYQVDAVPKDAIVVDVRDVDLYRRWHYQGATSIQIDSVMTNLRNFCEQSTYVFYCGLGLQTAVLAEQLQKRGYKAFSFKAGVPGLVNYAKSQGLDW